MFVSKFKNLKFWGIIWICNFDFVIFWLGIQYDSMVWVIMRRRGVSSERRHSSCSSLSYPQLQRSWKGVYCFHLVHLSVCGQNRVRSVSSTILIGSISYMHILSNNFRKRVGCTVCFKIQKFKILENSLNLLLWLCLLLTWDPMSGFFLLYPRFSEVERGGILVSPCQSVRLSVCGQNRVCSVSSTILNGSISYLHILSSNFRRCVACNACFKIQKFEILANFYICNFDFVFFWLGIQYDSMVWVIMRRREVSSERRHSSCSSLPKFQDIVWLKFWKS